MIDGKKNSTKRPALMAESFSSARNRYEAAHASRFTSREKGINRSGTNADFHAPESALYYLTERARDLDRNNILVGHTVDRLCSNVLHQGFSLEPDTGRKTANQALKAKFARWSSDKQACDVQGEFDFNFLSYLALRASIVDGDIVGLPLSSGQLQLVESHRIRTPVLSTGDVRGNTVNGVELNASRRRVRYWITNDVIPIHEVVHHTRATAVNTYDSRGNKQLFHVWHPKRATQTRGITKLAATMDFIRMHGDVHFAKLVQQQAISGHALVRERTVDFELPDGAEADIESELDPCEGSFRNVVDVWAGQMYTGYPGETLKVIDANVPAPTFFEHDRAIEQLIALNLDLPLIVMRLDASDTNFSGWRGALNQAKIKFRQLQSWFADCAWHGPIYSWLIRQWTNPRSDIFDESIAAIRESIGDRIFDHEWILPTWEYVQREVEQRADVEAIANGLSSPRRIQKDRGRRWNKVVDETIEDKVYAIEQAIKAAQKLNSKHDQEANPVRINWTHLISFPRPMGDTVHDNRNEPIGLEEESEEVGSDAGTMDS